MKNYIVDVWQEKNHGKKCQFATVNVVAERKKEAEEKALVLVQENDGYKNYKAVAFEKEYIDVSMTKEMMFNLTSPK